MTTAEIVRELKDAVAAAEEGARTHEGGVAYGYGRLDSAVRYLLAKLELTEE